jgi:hypothetical protein
MLWSNYDGDDDDDDEYIFVDDYINYSMIMIIINFHTSYII